MQRSPGSSVLYGDQVVAPEDSTKAVTAPAEPLLDET